MKRLIAIAVGAAGLVALPGVASAHIPTVTDNCQGLNVTLTNYEGGASNNQVVVTIDGAAQTFTFGGSFTRTFTWSTSSAHTWTVVIDANRLNGHPTQYDKRFDGTEQPCTSSSTTTTTAATTTTTTPPSTTTSLPTDTSGPTTSTSPPSTTTLPETTSSTVEVGEPPIPSSIPPTPPSIQPTAPPASAADPIVPVTGPSGTARLLIIACALCAAGVLLAHTARRP